MSSVHPINISFTWVRDTTLAGRAFPSNASHRPDGYMQLWINGLIQHIAAIEVKVNSQGVLCAVGRGIDNELEYAQLLVGGRPATTTLPGIDDGSIWVIYITPEGA